MAWCWIVIGISFLWSKLYWICSFLFHHLQVVPQHRYYSYVKKHGVGLTVECMRLSSISDELCEQHSLPSSGEVRVVPDLSTKYNICTYYFQTNVFFNILFSNLYNITFDKLFYLTFKFHWQVRMIRWGSNPHTQ